MALYPRSLWRFEVCPCRPTPGGRPPSPVKLRSCLKLRQSVLTAHYTSVFQAAPQPLDEDIIHPSAPSVHRNAHTRLPQNAGKSWRSELAALVGVEDFRSAEPLQSLLQRLNAEVRVHRIRDPPRQHLPRDPVHHRNQVEEAAPHRYIRDVSTPDLVRTLNHQLPQQIR